MNSSKLTEIFVLAEEISTHRIFIKIFLEMSTNEMATEFSDPFRHTCLIPYVDPASAPPAVADKLKILPFRRNIFYLLGHSQGLFPHLMGVIGGCFNGQVRGVQLLDWVRCFLIHDWLD